MKLKSTASLFLALALSVVGLRAAAAPTGSAPHPLTVTTPAFVSGQPIPAKFTCAGADVSPRLRWSAVPDGTKSIAVICHDVDAPGGSWTHWVIYNLPARTTALPEHVPTTPTLGNGARQGLNDFKRMGYAGPCPPAGKAHHYHFTVYALDTVLPLAPGATREQLLHAMAGHLLASGDLVGVVHKKE